MTSHILYRNGPTCETLFLHIHMPSLYVHNKSKLNIVYSEKKNIFEFYKYNKSVKAAIMRGYIIIHIMFPTLALIYSYNKEFPCGWKIGWKI